jgi:hypothetical protein
VSASLSRASRVALRALDEGQTLKSQAPRDMDVWLVLARGLEEAGRPADAYREILSVASGQRDAGRPVARLEGRRR